MTATPSPRRRVLGTLIPAAAGAALALPLAAVWLQAQPAPAPVPPPFPGLAPATAPATRPSPDSVIFTINGERVTLAEYELFVGTLPPDSQDVAREPGPGRRAWAESYANMKLLARNAAQQGLEKDPEVARMLAITREQVLANAAVGQIQEKLDEVALKKYYDDHRQALERVAARHVLIRFQGSPVPVRPGQKDLTKAEAKAKADALVTRLKGGEDFAVVARNESDDVGSGIEGGDLGSFTRSKMVAPFAEAAFAQKQGEVGAPVETKFGWHIIQVTGRFDTYEKVADAIRGPVAREQLDKTIKALRAQTPPQFNDAVVGPPLPPEPPEPGSLLPPPTTGPAPAPAPSPR